MKITQKVKKHIISTFPIMLAVVCCVCVLGLSACGEKPKSPPESVNFEYVLNDDQSGYLVKTVVDKNTTKEVVPDSYNGKPVVGIGNGAFFGCNQLKSVKMGKNVQMVGDSAFYQCQALESVELVNTKSIGDGAFYECGNLKKVVMSDLIESVSASAFLIAI